MQFLDSIRKELVQWSGANVAYNKVDSWASAYMSKNMFESAVDINDLLHDFRRKYPRIDRDELDDAVFQELELYNVPKYVGFLEKGLNSKGDKIASRVRTCLRLSIKDSSTPRVCYYRDAGLWEVPAKIYTSNTIATGYDSASPRSLARRILVPVKKEVWAACNKGYV